MHVETLMDDVVVVARIIANPVRLHIYRSLGERGLSLSDVARAVGVSVSGAHHHLARLLRARMVMKRYVGRRAIYSWATRRWTLICERTSEAPTRKT